MGSRVWGFSKPPRPLLMPYIPPIKVHLGRLLLRNTWGLQVGFKVQPKLPTSSFGALEAPTLPMPFAFGAAEKVRIALNLKP